MGARLDYAGGRHFRGVPVSQHRSIARRSRARAGFGVVFLFGLNCGSLDASAPPPTGAERTHRFLEEQRPRAVRAVERARAWLDGLEIDPLALRERGLYGKKRLAELLEVYFRLYQIAPAGERQVVVTRMSEITEVTRNDRYHDMLRVDDVEFRSESTSYLRIAYLMERMGLDTSRYREEIATLQPRLDASLLRRGAHQRMAFAWYYDHFGLTEPFDLARGLERGVIARRRGLAQLGQPTQVYALTHEIFVPFRYGEKLDSDFFDAEQRVYLRGVLEPLTRRYIEAGDPDLVGELVSCLRYLGFTDAEVYRDALEYLLDSQRPEGKWGEWEKYRNKLGDLADAALYLHTTTVAVRAITIAFLVPDD